jgi:predicted  nucleic acid-binding Zn-ribbon protein
MQSQSLPDQDALLRAAHEAKNDADELAQIFRKTAELAILAEKQQRYAESLAAAHALLAKEHALIDKLRKLNELLAKGNKDIQSDVDNLKKTISTLQERIADLEQNLTNVTNERDALQTRIHTAMQCFANT